MAVHNEKLNGVVGTRQSGSDRSPSLKETEVARDPLGVLHSVPDPDAGISDEERARRVGQCWNAVVLILTCA